MSSASAEEIVNRLRRRGRPSQGLTKQVLFRTTPEEHEELIRFAEENGMGMAEAVRQAIKLLTEEEQ